MTNNVNFNEIGDKLLFPISQEKPCGEYMKRHELYLQLKELRSEDPDNIGDMGVWKKETKPAQWENVIDLCENILTNYSKDLQVCAFYIEAHIKLHGFQGLSFGLSLMSKLCEKYWEEINPPLNPDNVEIRKAPFRWLQSNIPLLIRNAPLFKKEQNLSENFNWFYLEKESKLNSEKLIKTKDAFKKKFEFEQAESLFSLFESIKMSIDLLKNIDDFISSVFQENGQDLGFSETISLCTEIQNFLSPVIQSLESEKALNMPVHLDLNLNNNLGEKFTEQNPLDDLQKADDKSFSQFNTASFMNSSESMTSIEDAYRIISKAHNYLLKHDSHSPSVYLIRRALEWRKKSLYELFMELFTTMSKPSEIFTLLGLSPTDKSINEIRD